MSLWRRPVSLVNARVVSDGRDFSSIRFTSRVLSLDMPSERGDLVVDLNGAFVLPGLLNAHEHLELNHFGRLKFRESYQNASEWIDDMRPRLREDPEIREARNLPLSDRLLAGGLKNLFSGVTTVCHHNPFYRELRRFPLRVVRRYGWAHSFFLERQPVGARGERGELVERAYRKTPPDSPFVVHLAEGTDRPAREELARLDHIGCLGENTVLVHGVGITSEEWQRVRERGAGLVWCPSSNRFLFGRTASVSAFLSSAPSTPIALGTDSRLTGSRDLLEEMREGRQSVAMSPAAILTMVTTAAARLLRLPETGRLEPGLPADLTILPRLAEDPASALLDVRRSRLLLVAVGGCPLVGSPELSPLFAARGRRTVEGALDGEARVLDRALARRIRVSRISEPGLELEV